MDRQLGTDYKYQKNPLCRILFKDLLTKYGEILFGNKDFKLNDNFSVEYQPKRILLGMYKFYTREATIPDIANILTKKVEKFQILLNYEWKSEGQLLRGILSMYILQELNPNEKFKCKTQTNDTFLGEFEAAQNGYIDLLKAHKLANAGEEIILIKKKDNK